MNPNTVRQARGLLGFAASFLFFAGAMADGLDEPVDFDIRAQGLDAALLEFSEQGKIQVVVSTDAVNGHETENLEGEHTPRDALEYLLASTGLTYTTVGLETVAVAAPEAETPGKSQPASSQVLMAQNQTSAQSRTRSQSGENSDEDESTVPFDEIIVTGSHIRGAAPVGSQLITIDRSEIDRSGFATVQQVLQSLPQNFKGGVNEDTIGSEAGSNLTEGSSINLRGLGPSATLILVNGRRLPVAGFQSNFTDISSIPTSAIERIEILPDGASAIYGSDAIAGVVNIILRDDFDGAETQLRYGSVTEGSSDEYRFAQTFGKRWNSGNGLISYEYFKRERLPNSARTFTASADLRPFGGDDFRDNFSNPGNILDIFTGFTTVSFAIPEGQDGTSLTAGDLLSVPPGVANRNNPQEGGDILSAQSRHSVFATLSQELGDNFTLFAEGRYADKDFRSESGGDFSNLFVTTDNPFFVDPVGLGFVLVSYNFLDDIGPRILEGDQTSLSGVLGIDAELGGDWQVEVYGSYSKEEAFQVQLNSVDFAALAAALADPDPTTAFNPFGDGSNTNPATLASIEVLDAVNETISEVSSANVVFDGTLFDLAGGGVKLAAGLNYREEQFEQKFRRIRGLSRADFKRELWAVFGELYIPLVSEANSRPGLERLSISAAVRHEDYSGISNESTTDPMIGLLWSPGAGLNIRASWGTSFKTPNLADLDEGLNISGIIPLSDPTSPTGSTQSLVSLGNNADLINETAETWTIGVEFAPASIPDFQVDLNYFNIKFEDRNTRPSDPFNILLQESLFASRIVRNPTQAQIDAVCNDPSFTSAPALCDPTIVGVITDQRFRNEAKTEVNGLDLTLAYGFDTERRGRFDFGFNGSYMLEFEQTPTTTSPTVDVINTIANPVDLRLRSSVIWGNQNGVSAAIFVNYTDSYSDNLSDPARDIDSWTTVDLTLSYDSEDRLGKILNDTVFSINVLNLFDEDPPFVNQRTRGYDPANASPLGQFVSFNIAKNW